MAGPLTDQRLADLPQLSQKSLDVLKRLGFEFCTPVQAATIPLFTGNKDVVVDACTGSGKTLAFVLPLVEKLRRLETPLRKHEVGGVIVSPTRELAAQIFEVAVPFIDSVPGMKTRLLVGGTDIQVDFADLSAQGANILIGTPGRLADILLRCTTLSITTVEMLILDEADRLLDLGFEATLLSIIKRLPKQRRTGLFSATQTEAVELLVRAGMRNPVCINVATTRQSEGKTEKVKDLNQKTPASLRVEYVLCSLEEKTEQLVQFLLEHQTQKTIVYFLTCACVDYFLLALRRLPQLQGLFINSIHGKMKQVGREKAIKAFTEREGGVLLATDVAARGLDIPDVDWVIQIDAPQDPAAFVHRVGRTARMGRQGCARIYLTAEEEPYVEFVRLRKVPLCPSSKVPITSGVRDQLRLFSETDKEIMTKGILAFVSYVRAYANHQCSYIFRLAHIDYVGLAYARGLLTLPKVPEIKRYCKNQDTFLVSNRYLEEIPYKDQSKEKQRLLGIKRKQNEEKNRVAEEKLEEQPPISQPQTDIQREKKCRNPKKREFDELQGDYALLKLLKKGKITEHEFDAAMGIDVEDNFANGQRNPQESEVDGKDAQFPDQTDAGGKKKNRPNTTRGSKIAQKRGRRGVNKKLRNKLL